jgi:hypothetical protein
VLGVVPTLNGRIQTRIVLLAVVGGLITLIIEPFLPGSASLGDKYRNGFLVLLSVAVIGVLWELLYHLLMQWRWEKDWPTMFGLVEGVPEGALIWGLLAAGAIPGIVGSVSGVDFLVQFILVWLGVWLVANGPMRVPFIRWRFRGGRLA